MFWNKIKSYAPEIILLGTTAFLQFFRLGIGEIQSWDESLYLIRAEACIKFGAWFDQTQYAVGGLYSSTHPPLVIWMMAFTRMLFGNSVCSLRIVAASFAILALFFFYKLASRFFSRWTCLFATVSLGTAQTFLWYGHHAQLDIPMLAFIIGTIYFAIKGFENPGLKFIIISGILYACALLTKAIQPLYLLPLLFALPYIFNGGKQFKKLIILLLTAFIIAFPWYLFMLIRHSDFYSDYAGLVGSMKAGTYSNEQTTYWWYYVNQIIINFPILILAPIVLPSLFKRIRSQDTVYKRACVIAILWFGGMLIFISFFQTRMLHFVLFLFLPAAFVVCFFLEYVLNSQDKWRKVSFSAMLLVPALVWSGSELIRKSVREHFIVPLHSEIGPIIIVCILTTIGVLLLFRYFIESKSAFIFLTISLILLSTNYIRLGNRRDETFIDGARQAADSLLLSKDIHSIIAYNDGTPHEALLPQLNYYLGGWLLGWDKNVKGTTKTWSEIDSLIKLNTIPTSDAAIIYVSWDVFYKPTQDEVNLLARLNTGLKGAYRKSFNAKKYQIYWDRNN